MGGLEGIGHLPVAIWGDHEISSMRNRLFRDTRKYRTNASVDLGRQCSIGHVPPQIRGNSEPPISGNAAQLGGPEHSPPLIWGRLGRTECLPAQVWGDEEASNIYRRCIRGTKRNRTDTAADSGRYKVSIIYCRRFGRIRRYRTLTTAYLGG